MPLIYIQSFPELGFSPLGTPTKFPSMLRVYISIQFNLSYHHTCLSIASMPCVDCFPFISGVCFFLGEYDIEIKIEDRDQDR